MLDVNWSRPVFNDSPPVHSTFASKHFVWSINNSCSFLKFYFLTLLRYVDGARVFIKTFSTKAKGQISYFKDGGFSPLSKHWQLAVFAKNAGVLLINY